jgi:hypothetical protein
MAATGTCNRVFNTNDFVQLAVAFGSTLQLEEEKFMIEFGFVTDVINIAVKVAKDVIQDRRERSDERRQAVIGHLRRVSELIGQFVDESKEARFTEIGVTLCARVKTYAIDFEDTAKGANLSDAQYSDLKQSLDDACKLWPKDDAFHRPGVPLSPEARAALRDAMVKLDERAVYLSSLKPT